METRLQIFDIDKSLLRAFIILRKKADGPYILIYTFTLKKAI